MQRETAVHIHSLLTKRSNPSAQSLSILFQRLCGVFVFLHHAADRLLLRFCKPGMNVWSLLALFVTALLMIWAIPMNEVYLNGPATSARIFRRSLQRV